MAIQLNLDDYAGLNNSINEFFSSGKHSAVLMSVFTDADSTNPVTDAKGGIVNRQIASVNAVYSHTNANGQAVNGYITIKFTDGSSIVSTDNVDSYWYTLSGLAYVPRKFGSSV